MITAPVMTQQSYTLILRRNPIRVEVEALIEEMRGQYDSVLLDEWLEAFHSVDLENEKEKAAGYLRDLYLMIGGPLKKILLVLKYFVPNPVSFMDRDMEFISEYTTEQAKARLEAASLANRFVTALTLAEHLSEEIEGISREGREGALAILPRVEQVRAEVEALGERTVSISNETSALSGEAALLIQRLKI